MRKNFGKKTWFYPLTVLIIESCINAAKLQAISFAPVHNVYVKMGEKVGNAFVDGAVLK